MPPKIAATEPRRLSTEIRAGVLKAFAHPARLAMIEALVDGERCVCELQPIVGSDMSTVSRHLAVMRNAGIVVSRKSAQQIYYRLSCECIKDFLEEINRLCFDQFEREVARMRAR